MIWKAKKKKMAIVSHEYSLIIMYLKPTTSLIYRIYCNTMTCPYIDHTPHCGTGGGGVMEPLLPRVFDVLQYFETILLLVESLWSS